MATELSRQRAAQAWQQPTTKTIDIDHALAEAFAEILDEVWSQPWLGNATTRELLDEIAARADSTITTTGSPGHEVRALVTKIAGYVDLDYKTVDAHC